MPAEIWRLMLAYSLMMAGTSLKVLLAGIIGVRMAPLESLATLPIALAVIGVASSTLPTGRMLQRFGRRRVFLSYGLLAIFGALGAAASLALDSFTMFCASSFVIGWTAAAGHQYRFAALEAVAPERAAAATSVLLFGGILAAFIGPELAVRGRALVSTEYAGSYLLLCLSYLAGLSLLFFYRDHAVTASADGVRGRPMSVILASPTLQTAIAAAALSYAIMSFIMTATPISMHQHAGHSLEATKWVIQSHIVAMYLPSLAFPYLASRLGLRGMMWLGVLIYLGCLLAALLDRTFLNYWTSLVLLGIGWNFLFLAGTNLLPQAYRIEERYRVQSFNDFMVFSVQAMVSLGSGLFLVTLGWNGLLLSCIPLMLAFVVLMYFRSRD